MIPVTVIGGEGFIGSCVANSLRVAGESPWCPKRNDHEVWERDLGRVIYCAGLTGDYRLRPLETVEAHVSLLARLIEKASFERIVYLSTTRIYNLIFDGLGTEYKSVSVNPNDPEHLYELSKLLGESLALHHSDGRGVVARLSYVFDWEAGAQGFLSQWLQAARGSRSLTIDSSPNLARDYIHVDDVASALVSLANGATSGIVNVARGETLSNAAIAAVFEQEGWKVAFSRDDPGADRGVLVDTARLHDLGIRTRPVLQLIEEYLAKLN